MTAQLRPMVGALQTWLTVARVTDGPVFRSVTRYATVRPRRLTDHSVAAIVKRAATTVGLAPDQ